MNDIPNHNILLEILHQRKRVAKAEAADLAVKLKIDFDALLEKKFDFGDGRASGKKSAKIAAEAAAEVEKTVAERCEKLGIPREFAPGVTSMGWHGPSMLDSKKAELSRIARTVIEARLKAAARQNRKAYAGGHAEDHPARDDGTRRASRHRRYHAVRRPDAAVTYEEVEVVRGVSSRSRRGWSE